MHSDDVPHPVRLAPEGWIPLLAGLAWLWPIPTGGVFAALTCFLPGALLFAGGVSMLLMPGDRRIPQWTAMGGALGVVLALPGLLTLGVVHALGLAAASVIGFLAAGWHSVAMEPRYEEVPEPSRSARSSAQVAIDEALLAELVHRVGVVDATKVSDQARELLDAREMFDAQGWLDDPVRYHLTPQAPEAVSIQDRRMGKLHFEHLSFESEYEPHADEPGRDRWLGYRRNRTSHAWVVRKEGPDRPWLVCVHGYVMGLPRFDFGVFRPDVYLETLGLNMILPTLPLHGPRAEGWRSGDGFFGADVLDTIHAEAQAMWDLRRMVRWARTQTEQPIGVYGVSLGGYNASLLATLEDDLACVVAGIPVSDLSRIVFRHAPTPMLRTVQAAGMDEDEMRRVQRVISPLAMAPRVPREHRHIYAGVGDRIVPPDHPRDLWAHWEKPEITWYQGGHCTFLAYPDVRRHVKRAFKEAGLTSAA